MDTPPEKQIKVSMRTFGFSMAALGFFLSCMFLVLLTYYLIQIYVFAQTFDPGRLRFFFIVATCGVFAGFAMVYASLKAAAPGSSRYAGFFLIALGIAAMALGIGNLAFVPFGTSGNDYSGAGAMIAFGLILVGIGRRVLHYAPATREGFTITPAPFDTRQNIRRDFLKLIIAGSLIFAGIMALMYVVSRAFPAA